MKKFVLLLLFCLVLFAITVSYASTIEAISEERSDQNVKLPMSVTIIDDEAFEGTAIVKVEIPETVTTIGEYAFANIPTLLSIRIPSEETYIANTAFDGSNRITITAPSNSYARTYARTQGLPFSPIVVFCASTQTNASFVLSINRSTEIVETGDKNEFKPETQWRRIEEIKATRTEALIANYVQGRSPPMA